MKFKMDFITNSSSESFTTVIVDTIPAMIASGAITGLITAANLAFADATRSSREIAEAVAKEADIQTQAVVEGYSQAETILDVEKQKLQEEINAYKNQWADQESSADKTDPGYEKLKGQYRDYIRYLENQVQEKEYQKYVIEVQKAESQAAMESKNEWNRQRQVDLIAAKEEKALLQATLAGYRSDGFDVSNIESRLEQLKEREAELSKVLAESGASIDYEARDRGVIGAGKEFVQIRNEFNNKKQQLEQEIARAEGAKRLELERKMQAAEKEYMEAMQSATRWDMAVKAAEGVQFGADVAIDGLAVVTGPTGEKIKLAYKAGKNIAEGMGEGMADPKNAGKHLAKGLIGAATEAVTDSLGDSKFKSAVVSSLGEGAKSALDASIAGKDAIEAGVLGIGKGALDSYVDSKLGGVIDKLPIPKGSSVDVNDFGLKQIYNNNPLTKGLMKTMTREVIVDKIKGTIKDKITETMGEKIGLSDPE